MSGRLAIRVLRDPALLLASGFGAGLSPVAPGTVGSAVALLPYLALREAAWWWLWGAIALTFAVGVRASAHAIRVLGRADPQIVVLDEWVGQWLALALIELALGLHSGVFGAPPSWLVLVTGFVAFRACDIVKPWPARFVDRTMHDGFGTMLDDAVAALWAAALGIAILYTLAL